MSNAMPDVSDSKCGVDGESQRKWETRRNFTVGEIRSRDKCADSESSPHGVSSAGSGQEKLAGLCADDDAGRRCEMVAGSYASGEYDYIGFSDVPYSSHSQAVKKPEDGALGKLGPKTKETELRLGLPEEAENNDGLDVPGSRRGPSTKTLGACIGYSMDDALSTYIDNSPEGFRDSIVGRGASIYQGQQFLKGEVGGLNQRSFLAGVEPHRRGYSVHNKEEFKQKPALQEFTTRELPFDIRYSQHEKWSKPMVVIPPFNSIPGLDASDSRRAFLSGAKRVFSDTLDGRHCVSPQSDSPKLINRLPPPAFMFPFAGVPNTWQMKWESTQSGTNLGNLSGHTVAKCMPTLTPDKRIDCVGGTSSGVVQAPNQVVPGSPAVAPSENKSNPAETEAARNENGGQSEARTAPVVGWPPIRSFRRNLASQPKLATNAAPAPASVQKKMTTMFVKVNVEGVHIGRKIDLKAYDSYERLSVALDEMFQGSIPVKKSGANSSAENNEASSLLSGTDYVLVYEDDEGDRMLVGDVPWEMFVNTVKRLRVLKSSEARGLATRRQLLKTAE